MGERCWWTCGTTRQLDRLGPVSASQLHERLQTWWETRRMAPERTPFCRDRNSIAELRSVACLANGVALLQLHGSD